MPTDNVCYTEKVLKGREFWPQWVLFLQRKGLNEIAATLIEGSGPITILLAQLLHAGQPFFGRSLPANQWQALVYLLENPAESQLFAAFLREEDRR